MNMLSTSNKKGIGRLAPFDIAAIIGMAAIWMVLLKRLLYPTLYTYYRTGSDSAFTAQGIYAAVLILVIFLLLIGHAHLEGQLLRKRWPIALAGALAAAGMCALILLDYSTPAQTAAIYAGGAAVAACIPVHLAFWLLQAKSSETARTIRNAALSFALFFAIYLILELAGANRSFISIVCPLVSAAAAIFCVAQNSEKAAEPAVPAPIAPTPAAPAVAAPVPAASANLEDFGARYGLSEREVELAAYAYRNYSAKRIASELFIAESTVYTHLKRIYRKTDVHSKHELIDLIDAWKRTEHAIGDVPNVTQ